MARPLRIEYPGAFYHVINRGLSRCDIFLEDLGRLSFLDLLGDISRLWQVQVFAYCLDGITAISDRRLRLHSDSLSCE